MKKPFKITDESWWYKGCFIHMQKHPMLNNYAIVQDNADETTVGSANTLGSAKLICEENEVKDYVLGIESYGYILELPKKYKTYSVISYVRGIEINYVATTTSIKKFSELTDISVSHLKDYTSVMAQKYPITIKYPDTLFCMGGIGGEADVIFERRKIYTKEEIMNIIDKHREKFKSKHEFYQQKKY